jgi:hypothetical protein
MPAYHPQPVYDYTIVMDRLKVNGDVDAHFMGVRECYWKLKYLLAQTARFDTDEAYLTEVDNILTQVDQNNRFDVFINAIEDVRVLVNLWEGDPGIRALLGLPPV